MRVRLGRLIRDLERKMEKAPLRAVSSLQESLGKARRIWKQRRKDPDYLYSWHAPEVECIGKRKARHPYEFGNKVSLATNLRASKKTGKHFVLHVQSHHE